MTLNREKAHIVKHANHMSIGSLILRLVVIFIGIGGLAFTEFLPNKLQHSWWPDLVFICLVILGVTWLIVGLLSCRTTWCDTHKQEIVCKPLLGTRIKIPFSEVYKIKAWPGSDVNTGFSEKPISHEDLLHTSLDRLKFIGKEGVFITVEKTDKFNHVIYNFLGKVPLEVKG